MSEAQVQRQTDEEDVQTLPLASQITPLIHRQPEEEEEETTQAKIFPCQTPRISADLDSRIQSQRGGGQSLPESTRNFFEPRFGTDFSGVRVHTDAEANSLSREINARAFTVGRDIFVGSGQYNPYSSAGRSLLAHELTHTVQQGAVVRRQPVVISQHTPSPMVQGDWFGIRNKVEKYANAIPGYFLFKVILGRSPITGKKVPPTGINILRGVLTLIPVLGEQWFKQLKKTGAADKAGAWLDKEIKKFDIWTGINALVEIVKKGLRHVWWNRALIRETIAATVLRVRQFVRNVSGKIKEFILAGALKLAGSAGAKVLAVFKKAKDVFSKILDNPLLFIKNFLSAFAQGFSQFSKNILKHLKGGIFGWLFGKLSSAGVEIKMPKKFDAKGIFGLVAQVLEFTYEGIKARLLKHPQVKAMGPKATKLIELLEKSVGFVKELATKGPIVLWEKVEQSLGNLKQMVFDKLKQWVVFRVIGKAVSKLLLMMNPAGALLAVAEGIYKVVTFFLDRWEQIKGLVVSIFGSIRDIAFGNLKKAIAYVEKVSATGLTLVISFMARYVGLGNIGKEIQKILKAIREPIDKAIERVIGWLVKKAIVLWRKGKGVAKKTKEKLVQWWKRRRTFKTSSGKAHTLAFKGKGKKARLEVNSTYPVTIVPVENLQKYLELSKNKNKISADLRDRLLNNAKILTYILLEEDTIKKDQDISNRLHIIEKILKSCNLLDIRAPRPTKVVWEMKNGLAWKVKAEPLTIRQGNTKGESKTTAWDNTDKYKVLTEEPRFQGTKKLLVTKAHLLHGPQLHGPNMQWNLALAETALNTEMYKSSEEKAITYLYKDHPESELSWEAEAIYEPNNSPPKVIIKGHQVSKDRLVKITSYVALKIRVKCKDINSGKEIVKPDVYGQRNWNDLFDIFQKSPNEKQYGGVISKQWITTGKRK